MPKVVENIDLYHVRSMISNDNYTDDQTDVDGTLEEYTDETDVNVCDETKSSTERDVIESDDEEE